MGCYRTILVALDGSPDAQAALEHAATLARDQHACLVVMTVAPAPVFCGGIGAGATVVANLEPTFVHDLQEAVRSLPPDVGVESRLAHGPAARRILEVAEECRSDLIVMGFHGHGRLHQALRGSVSDNVARESQRPVLLVRAPRPAESPLAHDEREAESPLAHDEREAESPLAHDERPAAPTEATPVTVNGDPPAG